MAETGSTYVGALGRAFVGIELKNSPLPQIRQRVRELGRKGLADLMQAIGEHWHAEMLPKHFRSGNEQRYDIAPRTANYLARKKRIGIGAGKYVMNLLTGQSKRRMTYEKKITATSKQVTVRMNAPTYFTDPYDPFGNQPDKVKETLEVNRADLMLLGSFAHKRLNQLAAKYVAGKAA